MQIFSPAKINLFLRVLDKRKDGYHNIASLFQALDFGDTLHLELADKDSLVCSNPTLPIGPSNLVTRAVHLFREKTALHFHVRIKLNKQIPCEAGLGGGSSNAATTLWALNELCGRPATLEQLIHWGFSLGSDVPFFFSQGRAYCTGRGEILAPLFPVEERITLFKPDSSLSTHLMYQSLTKRSSWTPEELLEAYKEGNPIYINDFETAAFKKLPELEKLKYTLLEAGYSAVCMTGSGTAFFAIGHALPLKLSKVWQQSASFLHRKPGSWYNCLKQKGVAYENV